MLKLTRLWRYGSIERFHRPTDWGSRQHVYTLTVEGARQVVEKGDWPRFKDRVYNRVKAKARTVVKYAKSPLARSAGKA